MIRLGDLLLLPLRVAAEIDHFHAIEQRTGNVLDEVGRGDEQHLAQIERHTEIVVGERIVLRGIEHFEQRARRITLIRLTELVDFVEQEDGILAARLLHALDDAAGHGTHIGAAMPADVGFVTGTTERHADVLTTECARDRLRDAGLADTRRAIEEQDRTTYHRAGLGFARVGDLPFLTGARVQRRIGIAGVALELRQGTRPSWRLRPRSAARSCRTARNSGCDPSHP